MEGSPPPPASTEMADDQCEQSSGSPDGLKDYLEPTVVPQAGTSAVSKPTQSPHSQYETPLQNHFHAADTSRPYPTMARFEPYRMQSIVSTSDKRTYFPGWDSNDIDPQPRFYPPVFDDDTPRLGPIDFEWSLVNSPSNLPSPMSLNSFDISPPCLEMLSSPTSLSPPNSYQRSPRENPTLSSPLIPTPSGRHRLERVPINPRGRATVPPSAKRPSTLSLRTRLAEGERATTKVHFNDVAAHTAKCDECDFRNKDGMIRCTTCGWQCCRSCLHKRNGDRCHHSFKSKHVPEDDQDIVQGLSTANSVPDLHATVPRTLRSSHVRDTGQARQAELAFKSCAIDPGGSSPALNSGAVSSTHDPELEARTAAQVLVSMSGVANTKKRKADKLVNDTGPETSAQPSIEGVDSDDTLSMPSRGDSGADDLRMGKERPATRQSNRSSHAPSVSDQIGQGELRPLRRNPGRRSRPIDLSEYESTGN